MKAVLFHLTAILLLAASGDSVYGQYSVWEHVNASVELRDLLGNLVVSATDLDLSPGEHRISIDIHRVPAGTYMLTVRSGGNFFEEKCIVAR